MSFERLLMPIGEAMFTQRSVRKFRPDPIPAADLRLIVEAAVKAPNGGNMMFEVPKDVSFHFCIPLAYPAVKYGPRLRKPIAETAYLDRWGSAVSW